MKTSLNESWIMTGLIFCVCMAWGYGYAADIEITLAPPPSEASVVFMLFDSADAFGDIRDPNRSITFPANGQAVLTLTDLPAGTYALLAYHDENNNGRLDENFLGIPREPVAFSNNYRPKGPPSYRRARFELRPQDRLTFTMTLERPLGERGRLGVGIGMVGKSSPYRDYDGQVTQVIPAITYTGSRLQVFGPQARLDLAHWGKVALAAEAAYRIKAYEADKSPILNGMGDRSSTLMGGLALKMDLAYGMELSTRYHHDILDEIGGGTAQIKLDRSFQWGIARLSPSIGLAWQDENIAQHEFGVPTSKAMAGRPAYALSDTLNFQCGLSTFVELSRDWLMVGGLNVEFLDKDTRNSPIVNEDMLTSFFFAVNYLF